MYAIKEAVIAKEHSHQDLDAAIFFMDMRTYGKDFEKYYVRAEKESGVRFIRSRIHSVEPLDDGDLRIAYATESGRDQGRASLTWWSSPWGSRPTAEIAELAERLRH